MKYLFAAGGTGGHINPALACAGEIRDRYPDSQILFAGNPEKMEARLVPNAGFDFVPIKITGFQRKISIVNIFRNIMTVLLLVASVFRAKKIISDFKPDVVVGFGGYVSGPILREAIRRGIPTAIHEQNAYPGITNKALAKKADKVMLTVKKAEQYLTTKTPCIVTGLPVRGELLEADRDFSRAELGVADDKLLILSMGGSLGARTINEAMVDYISKRHNDKKLCFIHAAGQYGKWVPDKLREKGVDVDKEKNVVIREYIDDMARCMAAADLVVCRAGASSLSEIEAMGKASVLIPSPNVAENHQYHNAMALVANNAAVIIEEAKLTTENFTQTLDSLVEDKSKLRTIGNNAKSMSLPQAKKDIADIVVALAEGKK